ncbi:bifunctional diguanylate cyclase/phosphodiesterase [Herbaspirillum rhizosphaerae]|uniref:bifunctional diguanylate cyclase/phosphodiesterase n=1 Tax=Herbaspirillum rhizosphaerae TaxID=346179 RepID=UPI00067AEA39|nr:EAL domain-containing protein [Herbaspirillum rhizosphaerae]
MRKHLFDHVGFNRTVLEWGAFVAVLVFAALLIANFVWSERRLITASETSRMQMQTRIIEENLSHQFQGVRNALDSARDAIGHPEHCDAACQQLLLQSLKRAMPGVRAMVVINADGKIRMSADDMGDRHLDDRDFLSQISRMYSRNLMYLSQPYENTPGVFNIKLSVPLLDAEGRNAGVISAILNPEYFDAVMRSALYAEDMNSAITEEDGRRILFVPANLTEMRSQTGNDDDFLARHLRSGGSTSVLTGRTANGEKRMVVQRTVTPGDMGLDKTLVISLTRNLDRLHAGWHDLALSYLAGWSIFALIGALVLAFIQRRRGMVHSLKRIQEERQAEAAERMELALSSANLGLWDWHIPSDCRTVDARSNAILGYTAEKQHNGSGEWRKQVNPEHREALDEALRLHLIDSSNSFEAEYQMQHRDGHWVWIQCRGRVVQRDQQGRPLRMVGTRMDISARKKAEADIAHLAFYDGLTNLPNRRLLLDRLGHAVAKSGRGGYHGAVIFVDLDNFKSLNDTMGHDMGDQLLGIVALRLKQVTREADTVARLGGDEFVILLDDLGATPEEAANNAEFVCRKVLSALNAGYSLGGYELRSTPSIGVVMFGSGLHTVNDLLRQADMAMYEAKAAGRNTFRFFNPGMQEALDEIAMLESDLRHALTRRELLLHYQPIVDAEGRLSGVEALMRWRHPLRGLVFPGTFISQAEKSGIIVEFGEWALEAACEQLVHWSKSYETEHLTIAVNVSARQFRQPEFTQRILQIIERTGANPRRLKLELTESMLLTDIEDLIDKMSMLKTHGVGFSLDDFGTGYSSLSYLKKLPIDQLKIDKSFVQDMLLTPHASSIVRTIVSLAQSMGLQVVAEGVETAEQWAALRKIGCGSFQGYLFAKPGPIAELGSWFIASEGTAQTGGRIHQLALVSPIA